MNMKTKILVVLGGLGLGGVESLFMNILNSLDKDKYSIDFVIHHPENDYYKETVLKHGCKIYVCPSYKLWNHFAYKNWWEDFFNIHKEYKIVHSNITSTGGIILKAAKKHGIRTISHIHSVSYGKGFLAFLKTCLSKSTKKYADIKLGCSNEANAFLYGKRLANSNKCKVLKNGIDISKFEFDEKRRNEVRKLYKIDDSSLLIGTVGRIIPLKNPNFLIKLVSDLAEVGINFKFLWVGEGPLKNKVLKKIDASKLSEYFVFPESMPAENYLSALDVFVFPSLKEGLGMSLVEAQINGLKCLTSRTIPNDAIFSSRVIKLDTKTTDKWIEEIQTSSTYIRKSVSKEAKNHGYDINDVVSELQMIYSKESNND